MPFRNSVLGGSGTLVRTQEKSDNFVTGVSGWQLTRAGNFEANNGVFRGTVSASTFQGTDFVINTSGVFVYSGTPAAGNLIVSIAPAPGSDAFGNAYSAGINVNTVNFTSNATVEIFHGIIDWFNSQFVFNAQIAAFPAGATNDTPSLTLGSPTNAAVSNLGTEILLQGASADGTTSPGWIQLTGINANTGTLANTQVQVVGSVVATDPTVTPGTTPATAGIEAWHPITFANSWTNTTGRVNAKYRKIASPPNSVEVIGWVSHASISGSSVLNVAVPTAYRPASEQTIEVSVLVATNVYATSTEMACLDIGTGGLFGFAALPAGTTQVSFHGIYSLDA